MMYVITPLQVEDPTRLVSKVLRALPHIGNEMSLDKIPES